MEVQSDAASDLDHREGLTPGLSCKLRPSTLYGLTWFTRLVEIHGRKYPQSPCRNKVVGRHVENLLDRGRSMGYGAYALQDAQGHRGDFTTKGRSR